MDYRESDMTDATEYAGTHAAYICTHTYLKSEGSSAEGLILIKVS